MNIHKWFKQLKQTSETPELSRVGVSTGDLLLAYQPYDPTFTTYRRDEVKKNPYIYAALRNTRDELVGKWLGAGVYKSESELDKNLERQPQILAASGLVEHEAQANHLRWNIDFRLKRGWEQVIRQLDAAREDGKSVLEIMWMRQPDGPYRGTWVIDDLVHCDPDCFHYRYEYQVNPVTGEKEYIRQLCFDPNGGFNGKPVLPGKFICYSFDEERERGEGRSLLERLAVYDWYQRNNFVFWMVHLNRYGSPALLGKYPRGSSLKAIQKLIATIRSFQQESGLIIPDDQQIEILQAQQRDGSGFQVLNTIIVELISATITGNSMGLSMGETGSYAAAKATAAEMRTILLYARAKAIDSVINRQLIPWFMFYNYPESHLFPYQQILPPRAEDIYNPVSDLNDVVLEDGMQSFAVKKNEIPDIERLYEYALKYGLDLFNKEWIQPTIAKIRSANMDEVGQILMQPEELDPTPYADFLHRLFLSAYGIGLQRIYHQTNRQRFAEGKEDDLNVAPNPEVIKDILVNKLLMPKREFDRLSDVMKRKAFTIAGQDSKELQKAVRQAIMNAVDQNLDLKQIAVYAEKAFREFGIAEQTNYHAATVFRTNLESAFHDAQWRAIQEVQVDKQIALLEYITERDTRVRANHRKMDGIRRPPDDPVWQIWWPPNGYNCRCRIKIISKEEADRRHILPSPSIPNVKPDDGFISGPAGWLV